MAEALVALDRIADGIHYLYCIVLNFAMKMHC